MVMSKQESRQKRTATVAFKADPDAAHSNGRERKVKVEDGVESEGSIDVTSEEAMVMAWEELDVPWKDRGMPEEDGDEDVMSIIGCGTLASGIFEGMLRKYGDEGYMEQFNHRGGGDLPPFRFILNCNSRTSRERLEKEFIRNWRNKFPARKVVLGNNVTVAQAAKYVMLGCKPYMVNTILSEPGMKEALHGKTLISICGGVTSEDLEKAVYGNYDPTDKKRCCFIRVMPNTAARIQQSMTIISTPPYEREHDDMEVVEFLMGCVGEYKKLAPEKMDAATALAGSGPAFCLLMLEGMIDGAVAMGIPRDDATTMAAQTMKGAALSVMGGDYGDDDYYKGTHPAILRDQVTTPGGCTMGGLMVLEEEGVRGSIAKCIRRTTVVASQLGDGAKNVNGI